MYNTLNRLKQSGVIRELHEGGVTRFDGNAERHHHFICAVCGRIDDVGWDQLPELRLPVLKGARIESYTVTLRGICRSCMREEKEESKDNDRH